MFYVFREGTLDLLGIFTDEKEAEAFQKSFGDPKVHVWYTNIQASARCELSHYAGYVGQEDEISEYYNYFQGAYGEDEVPF